MKVLAEDGKILIIIDHIARLVLEPNCPEYSNGVLTQTSLPCTLAVLADTENGLVGFSTTLKGVVVGAIGNKYFSHPVSLESECILYLLNPHSPRSTVKVDGLGMILVSPANARIKIPSSYKARRIAIGWYGSEYGALKIEGGKVDYVSVEPYKITLPYGDVAILPHHIVYLLY